MRREGSAAFAKVPVDGSSKMPNTHMDAIEPFAVSYTHLILRDCGGLSCTGRGSLCFSGGFGGGLLSPGLHPLDLLGAHPFPAGKSGFVRDLDAAGKAPVQADVYKRQVVNDQTPSLSMRPRG